MPRRLRSRLTPLFAALACALAPAAARAGDGGDPPERYFYKGYDYGSQALFNPAYVIINRGFDVTQLSPHDRSPYKQQFSTNMENVWQNVRNPFPAIAADGWGTFLTQEIFPLQYGKYTARWVPNYTLHLIGGGESYAELREWYLDNDATPAVATVLSAATLMTAAFINESIENGGAIGFNTDCLADLYVFDLGGIVLYSFDWAKRFFSHTMVVSDWSLQPAITYPHGDLQNQGNYYAAKIALPFYPKLKIFGYGGMSTLGGLSYELGDGYSISAGAGGRISHFATSAAAAATNIISVAVAGAVFVDRRESLLASVEMSTVQDFLLQANLYPNAIVHTNPGIGLFTLVAQDGRFAAGFSFTHALGFGFGAGTL